MRLSASTLKIYMDCQLQAKFAKIDNLPREQNARATYGSCVHYGLEIYNTTNGDVDAALKAFRDSWDDPDIIKAKPDFWPKYMTFGEYRNKGQELIRSYHEKLKWEDRTIVSTEHRFLVSFGEHELTGAVDLIEERVSGNGHKLLRILDYKTNASAPSKATLQYNHQFTIYMYASLQPEFWFGNGIDFPAIKNADEAWARYKDMKRRAIWVHLANGKEIDAGAREDEDYMRLYRAVNEISRAVNAGIFVPSISADACLYCPYTKECGIVIPERDAMNTDEEGWI